MKWDKIKFKDLYAIPSKNGLSKPSRIRGTGYPMVNMGELFANSRIGKIKMELVPLNDREIENSLIKPKDLLFARQSILRDGAGQCSIVVDCDEITTFESHLIRVRLNENISDPYFYYYYFKSKLSPIVSIVQQGVQAGIRASELQDLYLIYPPLPTQRRIASILCAYDDLIENNLQRIKLLEEAARCEHMLMVELHGDCLKRTTVFEFADIMSGGTPKTGNNKYWNGTIPFFTPKDLGKDSSFYLESTERSITEDGLDNCNSDLFERDTIFITARGTVGKLVLAKRPSAISQSNYALKSKDGSSQLFLFLTLMDKVNHFKQIAVGGVFDTIIVDTFKQIKIELPPKNAIKEFDKTIKPVFGQIDNLQQQNTQLRQARDILLPILMSGEIDVTTN